MIEDVARWKCDKCGKTEDGGYREKSPPGWFKLMAEPAKEMGHLCYVKHVCPGCFLFFWTEHFGALPTYHPLGGILA